MEKVYNKTIKRIQKFAFLLESGSPFHLFRTPQCNANEQGNCENWLFGNSCEGKCGGGIMTSGAEWSEN